MVVLVAVPALIIVLYLAALPALANSLRLQPRGARRELILVALPSGNVALAFLSVVEQKLVFVKMVPARAHVLAVLTMMGMVIQILRIQTAEEVENVFLAIVVIFLMGVLKLIVPPVVLPQDLATLRKPALVLLLSAQLIVIQLTARPAEVI